MMKINFASSDKHIGRVLFIVEGNDEIKILYRIFTKIFDYKYEKLDRYDKYKAYNTKDNPLSSIFVINTENSDIKNINDGNKYLDGLYIKLINEYGFPVNKAAIYYVFDRDKKSNTDNDLIKELILKLNNARESSNDFDMPGLLLLSWPSIESFTMSNYISDSFAINNGADIGNNLKKLLNDKNISYQKINKDTLKLAVQEMYKALERLDLHEYDLDDFKDTNLKVFNYEEDCYKINKKYRLLSLLCIALIDLGLITIEE